LPAPNFAGAKRSCGRGLPAPRPPHAFALKLCPQEAGHSAVLVVFSVA